MSVVRERQEPAVSKFPSSQPTGTAICWEAEDNWRSKTTGEKSEATVWTCWVLHIKLTPEQKCWGDNWICNFRVQERGQDCNYRRLSHQQISSETVMPGWEQQGMVSGERDVRIGEMGREDGWGLNSSRVAAAGERRGQQRGWAGGGRKPSTWCVIPEAK